MFSELIYSTPFTGTLPDKMFPNINGDCLDGTMLSTMRALLPRRIGDNVVVFHAAPTFVESRFEDILDDCARNDTLTLLSGCTVPEMRLTHKFEGIGYRKIGKFSSFFQKSFGCFCFVNDSRKSSVIVIDTTNLEAMHAVASGILPALPWYNNVPITDEERELSKSLLCKTPGPFRAALDVFANTEEYRVRRINAGLSGFEKQIVEGARQRIQAQVNQCNGRIAAAQEIITTELRNIADCRLRLSGLELSSGDCNDELKEFFLSLEDVNLCSAEGDFLQFTCRAKAYGDEDVLSAVLNSRNSWIHKKYKGHDFSGLLKAVFIDHKYDLYLAAEFQLRCNDRVMGCQSSSAVEQMPRCMPNPHIQHYGCLGDFLPMINEAIIGADYQTAVLQCVESAGGLTFNDGAVMDRFIEDLEMTGKKCLYCRETREYLRPRDVVLQMEKEDA